MKKLLGFFAAALVAVGCGGAGAGGGSGPSGRMAVFASDAMDGNDHVWVTIYKAELLRAGGSTAVFSSSSGHEIDLRSLRDGSGERFKLISDDSVPEGTYTGIRITMADTLVVFPNGSSTGTSMTFAPSFAAGAGKSAITLDFPSDIVVNEDENEHLVIDFDLANWNESGGIVTPVLALGDDTDLNDEDRQDEDEFEGSVSDLSGTAPNQTFTLLSGDGFSFAVQTDANTEFEDESGVLANGAEVEVEGKFDVVNHVFVARSIEVEESDDEDEEDAEAEGELLDFNAINGTLSIAIDEVEGFLPNNENLQVVVTANTEFSSDDNDVTKEQFFAALSAGADIEVEGSYNSGTGVFTASELKLDVD